MCFTEIIQHSARGEVHALEKKLHNKMSKPETKDIEESLLVAIQNGHDYCIPCLVVAGARRLDCALYLAIQLERVKAIAILLLCKATITGDCAIIKSLLSEPPECENAPWYMVKVHSILSQGVIKMSYPIAVSIIEKNYEATKELLLRTDLDMRRKQVDWSKLKLTLLHPSWVYSIAPWVVSLKLINNHLRKLPSELFSATQLRRLNLSQNLLENLPADIFALPNLEYLTLAHNRLKEIPETDVWTQSLLSLDLAENLLTTLPQGIQNSSIEILNLSKNNFTTIPKCLCRITSLTSLDLSSTLITTFPPEMQHLDHLVNLNVTNANISDLPGGGEVLRGYIKGVFKARARTSKVSPHIKLMLVCNTDRVKGAVLSRLKPHFSTAEPLPEFDQFQWSYRPFFTRTRLLFNTWLLGSSYECNSIYPCFFTSGALYVLVWDTTTADIREEIKIYVDNLVRHAPSSNIFIINVIPDGYETWMETNFDSLAKRLCGFFSKPAYSTLHYHGLMMLVAKSNIKDGQSDIKQQIYDIASNMTINGQIKVNVQYPGSYFDLIPVLEKEQSMFNQRKKPGVLEETSIWKMFDKALSSDLLHRMELPVMIDFLQEAGFLLHFEDPNDHLDQYYFTRPMWLYNTLLRVVRHAIQHSTRIEVTYNDLCSIADINWSKDVSAALVRLMVRYAVVLPTRNNLFIITCLLPHCTPPLTELKCGNLRRQFAPKSRGIPVDLWVRVICRVLTNLARITSINEVNIGERNASAGVDGCLKSEEVGVSTGEETNEVGVKKKPRTIERWCSSPSMKKNVTDMSPTIIPETVDDPEEQPAMRHVKSSSILTAIHLSNRDRIEQSDDDGLTPVEDIASRRNVAAMLISTTESVVEADIDDSADSLTLTNNQEFELETIKGAGNVAQEEVCGISPVVDVRPPPEVSIITLASAPAAMEPPHTDEKNVPGANNPTESVPLGEEGGRVIVRSSHGGIQSAAHPSKTFLQPHETREPSPNSPPNAKRTNLKSNLQRISSMPARRRETKNSILTEPSCLEKGLWVWDSGIIYNAKGICFSIYSCRCDISAVEERGLEVCSTLTLLGRVVFARLCRLIQLLLQERYPDMFSTELLLHKHELTQLSICPVCLESKERNPTSFLVEACVHALLEKTMHNCRYHPKAIPLCDLIPDYLMVDFSSNQINGSSFNFNESRVLHQGSNISLYDGNFGSKRVAVKVYNQVDGKSITFPLYFIRQELEMLTSLKHPNIVKVFGYSLQPPCVLLEKSPHGNLYQKLMDTEQKISRLVRFHIACQIASALEYLHKKDVVYRTLKASSILVWSLDFAEEVNVKLANFERAQFKSPSGHLGKTLFASYPAPEMLRYSFKEEYSEKVDIYSFGILLYELVTRWQPFGGIYTDHIPMSQRPKFNGVNTSDYAALVNLMEVCWQEDPTLRPSAVDLIHKLHKPAFQCHIATQVLRDCTSVRDCCFVPSMRQVWVYAEYSHCDDGDSVEGTQVFILNSDTLTIQGTLEFKERASAVFTVDNKVWIGMTEACVHAYDTTTFRFTDRFKLNDSVTVIADNDCYIFVAQANGHLNCYPKLAQKECQVIDVEIGSKAIIAMITLSDIIWLSCGNELVVLSADDDAVRVEARWPACSISDQIYHLVLSKDDTIVWSEVRGNLSITSWDVRTCKKKHESDFSEHLKWICCELNYDPTYLRLSSLECVQNTLWLGLTCGVIVILTATERPQIITFFQAHCSSPKVIMEIPEQEEVVGPMVITGGFGEVSSVSSDVLEQSGIIMSWHAPGAEDFQHLASRQGKYFHSDR